MNIVDAETVCAADKFGNLFIGRLTESIYFVYQRCQNWVWELVRNLKDIGVGTFMQIQYISQDQCGIDCHVDPKGVFIHFKNLSHSVLNSDGADSCFVPIDRVLRSEGVSSTWVKNQVEVQNKANRWQQLGSLQERAHGRVCGEVPVNEWKWPKGNTQKHVDYWWELCGLCQGYDWRNQEQGYLISFILVCTLYSLGFDI